MTKKSIIAGIMGIMMFATVPAFAGTPHHDDISVPHHAVHHSVLDDVFHSFSAVPHHAVHHSADTKHKKEVKPPHKEVKPAPAPENKDLHHKDKKPLPPVDNNKGRG